MFEPSIAKDFIPPADTRGTVKKFLLLLLILLPLQWTAAAMAAYCQHETGMAAKHAGHHQHKHQGAGKDASEKSSTPSSKAHNDCGMCHLNCGGALGSCVIGNYVSAGTLLSPRDRSHLLFDIASRPERPNWELLA